MWKQAGIVLAGYKEIKISYPYWDFYLAFMKFVISSKVCL